MAKKNDELLLGSNWEQLFREAMQRIILYYREQNILELSKEVEKQMNFVRIEGKRYKNDSEFLLGKFTGMLCAFDEFILKKKSESELFKMIDNSKAEDIPHSEDIFQIIYHEQGIRHGKLAEKAGIDRSTLTPIMDKLVHFGLVTYERPGKFKYYYLTPIGEEYYQKKLLKVEKEFDLDYLIEALLISLSKSADPTASAQKITNAIIASQYKFKGYTSICEKKVRPANIISEMINKSDVRIILKDGEIDKRDNRIYTSPFTLSDKNKTINYLKLSVKSEESLSVQEGA